MRTIIILAYLFLVALGGYLAYRDKMFWLSQMKAAGIDFGLPFFWHTGMWSDVFVMTPILWIIFGYVGGWNLKAFILATIAGVIGSLAIHVPYLNHPHPGAHIHGGHLTESGWVHAVYSVAVVGVLVLFYFFTPSVKISDMWIVTILLVIHLFLGTLIPLGLAKLPWFPERPHYDWRAWFAFSTMVLICGGRLFYLSSHQ
ncbi:hypothetical protein KW783_03055 [Candidatus Parcubacteria bacterium]|nr:hypothetical protein [Candidatus Parcubacteria bacterium]